MAKSVEMETEKGREGVETGEMRKGCSRRGEGRGGACSGGSPGIGPHRIQAAAALASDWLPQLGLAGRPDRGSLAPSWRAGRPRGTAREDLTRDRQIYRRGGGGG